MVNTCKYHGLTYCFMHDISDCVVFSTIDLPTKQRQLCSLSSVLGVGCGTSEAESYISVVLSKGQSNQSEPWALNCQWFTGGGKHSLLSGGKGQTLFPPRWFQVTSWWVVVKYQAPWMLSSEDFLLFEHPALYRALTDENIYKNWSRSCKRGKSCKICYNVCLNSKNKSSRLSPVASAKDNYTLFHRHAIMSALLRVKEPLWRGLPVKNGPVQRGILLYENPKSDNVLSSWFSRQSAVFWRG